MADNPRMQRAGRRGGNNRRIGSGRFHHSPERSGNQRQTHSHHDNVARGQETEDSNQQTRGPNNSTSHHRGNARGNRGRNRGPSTPSNLSWRQGEPRQQNQGNWRQTNEVSQENAGGEQRRQFNPFSYHNLLKFANESNNNDVVNIFANPDYDLEFFLKEPIRLDLFLLFMKNLVKVCNSDYDESKLRILSQVCEVATFVNSISSMIFETSDCKSQQQFEELILNILALFETVASLMPLTACDKLSSSVQACFFSCKGLCENKKISLENETLQKFQDIISAVQLRKKEVNNPRDSRELQRESRNERLQKLAPPDDFRSLSLYPTSKDVLCKNEEVFLRPNLVKGKYKDVEHYLDVQFRLLREDFIRPLREGIEAYITGNKELMRNTSVRVYENVRFIRAEDKMVKRNPKKRDAEGVFVLFDPKKKFKKVDWEHTRKFMYGSLLCFSRDKFRTLLMSTVSDRDIENLNEGLLRVMFSHEVEENYYQHQYTMVESEVFFDPYFHVLKTMQSLTDKTFPLPEYLVYLQADDFPPAYLEPKSEFQPPVTYRLPVGNEEWPIIVTKHTTWPKPEELGLDNSQWLALHTALTRELVVIQGPPGTGKTFIGLKIAEILINNKAQTGRNTPILVVCLTNHALDQFLLGILRITNKIIRIGGQSKCRELDDFNLRVVKKQTKSRDQMKLIISLKEEIKRLKLEVQDFDGYLTAIKSKIGIVSFEMLQEADVLPVDAIRAFQNGRFLIWLLDDASDAKQPEVQVVNHVKFDLLLAEFENKIEELEQHKIQNINTINLEAVNDAQQHLHLFKQQIEMYLNSEEIATKQQHNNWIKYLWKLNPYQRWQLYNYWIHQLEDRFLEEIRKKENEILKRDRELQEVQIVDDLEILRECDVIGMTTTGAARLHTLLRKLCPEIVVVEEAAEVMESHVVACLTEKCCHLILIGDHKQLRPQIATYELEKKFSFDVSLFERMVLNRGNCVTLEKQHRMAPDIANLITPTIYEKLLNASQVKSYPEIMGLPKRLYFLDHTQYEELMDADSNSRINRHEASFILALCRHLILQGYDSSKITILTTYRGQMFHIRKELKQQERLNGVLAQVVDNYQGEENDIILLSLVRSNEEKHTGFLKTENRVCVALSRARHALYIIGNMTCLTEDPKAPADKNIWKKIKTTLEAQKAIGPALPLRCVVHPEQHFSVSSSKDFLIKSPQGGCLEKCLSVLLCGHPCNQTCHVLYRDHSEAKCLSPCDRLCNANTHLCKKKCYEDCGDCNVAVEKILQCGHKIITKCHIDKNSIRCDVEVEMTFFPCEHKARVPCHVDPYGVCPRDCDNKLPCGHSCINKCHANEDPDHETYICRKPCGRLNAGCSMNHECGKLCCDPCADCIKKVEKRRSCDHVHYIPCSIDPELVDCDKQCTRTLGCGHKCTRVCWKDCEPCQFIVPKKSDCGHLIDISCGIKPTRNHCTNKCKLLLPCGHRCMTTCNKPCTTECKEPVSRVLGKCGHMVNLLCYERQRGLQAPSSSSRCTEACLAVLECGHLCPGTCGTCYQGRFHELCSEPCGRTLVCGHSCKQPCAEMCPPCEEKCDYFCEHSKCPKKCGEPCVPCKERCKWQCSHKKCTRRCGDLCNRDPCDEPCAKKLKCGHDCIGFCGDPCPQHCRHCDQEMVSEIFFGSEDDPDARFVYLVDCGHIIEFEGMQQWMAQNKDVVSKKACPRCTRPICMSLRYGDIIKQSFLDILKVKNINFGNPREIEKKRQALVQKALQLLQSITPENSEFEELTWCLQATIKSLGIKVDKKKNVLNSASIRCREIEVDVLSRVCDVWCKCQNISSSLKEELKGYINIILDNLEAKKHRLSQQQVIDFNLEVRRLQKIAQYMLFKFKASGTSAFNPLFDRFKAIILDHKGRFSEKLNQDARIQLEHIQKEINNLVPGLGITRFEQQSIIQALQMRQGHWFKCPNGHPYVITECGGAMQVSTCNECGADIGGRNHTLRSDNTHFREMDGSHFPAWSEQANNMENFNFDMD